jgi:repressor LexA
MESMERTERATKKQQELLSFVTGFITEHGYGPSYREIMSALSYKSVSTVAVHVEGLIAKGYLRRGENAARSLEIIQSSTNGKSVEPTDVLGRIEALIKTSDEHTDRQSLIRTLELLGENARAEKYNNA